MLEIQCCTRWKKSKLLTLFFENKDRNNDFAVRNAFQFYFGSIVPKKEYELTEDLIATYKKYTVVRHGDIVINGLNLNYDFVTQRVSFVHDTGIITSAYIVLRARENVNAKYYCYLFKALDAQKIFNGMGTGIRLTLSYRNLKYLELPVPPLSEQERIAKFLDYKISRIEKLISIRKRQIIDLEDLKKALINRAVTQGGWKVQRIRETFSFRKGLSITKADLEESGVAVISYGQVHSKKNSGAGLNQELIRYVNESYLATSHNALVEKGDFIFADTSEDIAGCGNCVYVDSDDTIFAGYHTIIAHNNAARDNKYLAYLFQSSFWRSQIHKQVNGVKVYSITQKILKNTYILFPPLSEQIKISEYLDKKCSLIDRALINFSKQIEALNELKARLISDCVTGRINILGQEN